MEAGLREIIKKTYNDSQFSGLTISQMESLCEAKNVNHVPRLLLALQNGNDNVIDEYGVLIKNQILTKRS